MPNNLPPPALTLSQQQARQFLLAQQQLLPPRSLQGKTSLLEFIQHVGCIQFDPLNVVGQNPDLVLQSRIVDYKPEMLEQLLYQDRQLLDGWDKVAAIYLIGDWPYFSRHRAYMVARHIESEKSPLRVAMEVKAAVSERDVPERLLEQQNNSLGLTWEQVRESVLAAIQTHGPLSSNELKDDTSIDWTWGKPTRLSKAAMETLYATGDLIIHHRSGTRRYFDLAERHIPAEIYNAPDPNTSDPDYQDWHVLRRIGGMGLAHPRSADHWLGILGVKSPQRTAALHRLVEGGKLVAVAVEGVPEQTFFMRAADLPVLEDLQSTQNTDPPQAAVIAALDNLIWDRQLTRWIFDFDYIWEVYKPKAKRQYGYYVLPVIYGDRFVARFDPSFDKQKRSLTIDNWWWEEDVHPDEAMETALLACFQAFNRYLNTQEFRLGVSISTEPSLRWLQKVSA
jgi:uncharacterized protein YcaQ